MAETRVARLRLNVRMKPRPGTLLETLTCYVWSDGRVFYLSEHQAETFIKTFTRNADLARRKRLYGC